LDHPDAYLGVEGIALAGLDFLDNIAHPNLNRAVEAVGLRSDRQLARFERYL
jgi:hypothetical protein